LIVTSNLPACRERDVAPFNLQAIHPDDLLLRLFRADPDARLGILRQQELDGRKPPQTQSEILDGPAVNAPRFVVTIRQRLKAPWQAREIGQSVTAQRCRIRFLNRQMTVTETPLSCLRSSPAIAAGVHYTEGEEIDAEAADACILSRNNPAGPH